VVEVDIRIWRLRNWWGKCDQSVFAFRWYDGNAGWTYYAFDGNEITRKVCRIFLEL